jgi:hypothetical protein
LRTWKFCCLSFALSLHIVYIISSQCFPGVPSILFSMSYIQKVSKFVSVHFSFTRSLTIQIRMPDPLCRPF